ncbi:MAG: Rho termination factor N-terminal domain-containing protein [Actinobacteria bacterium]|nr:Rho termination factor N-terminal domain-containing protein [Actinomycetota bacterium]
MTKTELESKHLADLHQLAADAGVERYRLLTRAELIERLGDGDGDDSASGGGSAGSGGRSERPKRRRRRSTSGREREERIDVEEEEEEPQGGRSRSAASSGEDREEREDSGRASERNSGKDSGEEPEGSRPRRRRRRRRFGRRREGVTIQDLLLPAESGRQAVLLAEGREAVTELLRSVAADLAAASDGPDPVALLIDPSPEELADWKREVPQAELVSAGQARHTSDALASAQRRAAEGEDVILLVDSLTRFADSFGDSDAAKELFDAGRAGAASGKGSLTVVVALERS